MRYRGESNGEVIIMIMEGGNVKLTMSVPKSIHKMVTVPRGSGTLAKMNKRKGEISGILEVKV